MALEHHHGPDAIGQTRVLGCCVFTWTQEGSVRYAFVEESHHEGCVQELVSAATAQGVVVVLVHRTPERGSS